MLPFFTIFYHFSTSLLLLSLYFYKFNPHPLQCILLTMDTTRTTSLEEIGTKRVVHRTVGRNCNENRHIQFHPTTKDRDEEKYPSRVR
ncbi:hypothetical protein HanIR_Chr01g0002841 [Helianthus annuus]|nr:hypothetical protein HanIR_Chr01g0002841 [Helianthus annuus]